MAAKPKLTQDEWSNARKVWESDQRKGFPWLIEELGLPVSSEALRLRSKSEGWSKGGKPSLETKPKQAKTKLVVNNKTKLGKTEQPTKATKIKPKATEPESAGQALVEVRKIGRPTKYLPEYAEQAGEFCLMGATDAKLAERFEVNVDTIYQWKLDHPEFSEAIRYGKDIADAKMAGALYKSGMGLHFIEEDKTISNGEGGQEVVTLRKQIEPSVAAQRHWLNNRQGHNWKDRQEVSTTIKLDKEMLAQIEVQFVSRMLAAHERQRAVLLERGITIDQE